MKSLFAIGLLLAAHENALASLISVNFSGEMTALQQQTFLNAAGYWNSVITGYDLTIGYNSDNSPHPDLPHSLTITASLPYIDGVHGILGSAGWETADYYDDNPVGKPSLALYYARTGSMQFDSADVAAMLANQTFYAVVLHEMAHVIGFGTLWTVNTAATGYGATANLYTYGSGRYLGSAALAEWKSEFNRPADADVPVELGGGAGTANGHWNEQDGGATNTGLVSSATGMDLSRELMTGWASDMFFISRATLGSLDDLGYQVDYSKAGLLAIPEIGTLMATLLLISSGVMIRRRNAL